MEVGTPLSTRKQHPAKKRAARSFFVSMGARNSDIGAPLAEPRKRVDGLGCIWALPLKQVQAAHLP